MSIFTGIKVYGDINIESGARTVHCITHSLVFDFQDKRETYIKQLIPRNQPLNRIKVKIFGNQGVGKTTVIDSLKCGYFGSFFRKARLTSSSSVTNGKQKSKQSCLCIHTTYRRHILLTFVVT